MRIQGRRLSVKLAGFVGCVVLAAPLGLAAQNTSYGVAGVEGITKVGPDGQAIATTHTVTPPNPCPVFVQASHLSDGGMVKTGADHFGVDHAKGAGQRLHLKMTSPDARTIASATVNVRGWTAKGRTALLEAGDAGAPGVRALAVPFTAGGDRTATADVWAPGLTAVVSIELMSVKYSDGSTWTPAQGKTCRVAPDPLMLVTQR
jgi:hypothetical protein